MNEEELNKLESDIIDELEAVIGGLTVDTDFRVHEIQPPSSIVRHAAQAAAQVLMAFERGYRMESWLFRFTG